ncbi:MAG: hypothetical protein Fur0021_40360 [Candidatus Promineifilaceae bacterium]
MPALPPALYESLVRLCEPHFRLPEERDAHLLIPLSAWKGFSQIEWGGSAHAFTTRLIYRLPGPQLQDMLRSLLLGHQAEAEIARLCAEIDKALALTAATHAHPLHSYYQALVQQWSSPRFQLDSRFVQLTLLLDQGPEAQGIRFIQDARHGKYDSLKTLLAEVDDRALVLLGRPGCGKTTLLRRLQLEYAWDGLAQPGGQIPFLAPLNNYRQGSGSAAPDPHAWLAQEWRLLGGDLPDFDLLLQNGRLLLLLDGLNEIPHSSREEYVARITDWQLWVQQATARSNTVVFSCRSLDYSAPLSSERTPVRQVQVEPLTPPQIEQFLQLYLGAAAGDPIWQTLRQDEQQLALFATPFFLRLLVDQVAVTGELLTSRAALLTGFVRRALHREIQERHHRLFQAGALLTTNDIQQVMGNRWAAPAALPQQGALIPKLEQLAYAMQGDRAGGEAGQVRIGEEAACALLNHPLAADILAAGIQLNVLDKEVARQQITFLHQLLQEYFAARVLARTPAPERVQSAWRASAVQPPLAQLLAELAVSDPLPALPTTGWEETTLLAATMAANQEPFVAGLMEANLPLAARCAAAPEVQLPARLVGRLQEALLARIGDVQADLRARIAAAEALAELGDPRFARRRGPHGDYVQPPLVLIAAGNYPIGDNKSEYKDEKPAHKVQLAAFEIGVFPVTNAEYRLFMAAGGYEEERWWETEAARLWRRGEGSNEDIKQYARDYQKYLQGFSEEVLRQQRVSPDQIEFWMWARNSPVEDVERQYEAWSGSDKQHRQPAYWDDSRFNHAAQPVVGVSWYEVRAYCAWLSAQTGDLYRLPTEVEWEAAARGRKGRVYAYGNSFDAAHCNTFETHIRRTTPVGVFPGGQTPEGVADLSGNVWEWTSTAWGKRFDQPTFLYPYQPDDGREDPTPVAYRRVLRGGAWNNNSNTARAANRGSHAPADRNPNGGFRLVCVRRPPSH